MALNNDINLSQVATAKDIAGLLGISHRTAERWLTDIRKSKKKKRAPVTIGEVFIYKEITLTGTAVMVKLK